MKTHGSQACVFMLGLESECHGCDECPIAWSEAHSLAAVQVSLTRAASCSAGELKPADAAGSCVGRGPAAITLFWLPASFVCAPSVSSAATCVCNVFRNQRAFSAPGALVSRPPRVRDTLTGGRPTASYPPSAAGRSPSAQASPAPRWLTPPPQAEGLGREGLG